MGDAGRLSWEASLKAQPRGLALAVPGEDAPDRLLRRNPGLNCLSGYTPGLNFLSEPTYEVKPESPVKAFPHPWLQTQVCNLKLLGFDSCLGIVSIIRAQKPTGSGVTYPKGISLQ